MDRLTALEALAASDPEMATRIVRLLLHRRIAEIVEIGSHEDRKKLDGLDTPDYENGESEIFIRFRVTDRRRRRTGANLADPLARYW